MVLLGNIGILSGGIGLAFPSVTLNTLTDRNATIHLNEAQASWYCKSV